MAYPGDMTLAQAMAAALDGSLGEPPEPFDPPGGAIRLVRAMMDGRLLTLDPNHIASHIAFAIERGWIGRVSSTSWGDAQYALTGAGRAYGAYLGGPPLPHRAAEFVAKRGRELS